MIVTLNLADIGKSNINYEISKFPDGQQDVVIKNYTPSSLPVMLSSRFNNFRDLELIVCATKALRRLHVKNISLHIPYILGARSDRKFQEGGTSYLVDVIAPIINSLEFNGVTCADAHSDVAEAVINRLLSISSSSYIRQMLSTLRVNQMTNYYLVSPDAGALKKVYKIANALDYDKEIIVATKNRSIDGTLSQTRVNFDAIELTDDDTFIICDDICDGGRTFIELSKAIKKHYMFMDTKPKVILVVTHGIFSAGFEELSKHIDVIVTTNSVSDIAEDVRNKYNIHQTQVI